MLTDALYCSRVSSVGGVCDFCYSYFIGFLNPRSRIKNVLRPEVQGPEGYGATHCILLMEREVFDAEFSVIHVGFLKKRFQRVRVFQCV